MNPDALPDFSALTTDPTSGLVTFNTSTPSPAPNTVIAPASPASGTNWLNSIGSFISSAGQVIQQGVAAVKGVQGVVTAPATPTAAAVAPVPSLNNPSTWPKWVIPAIAGGVLLVLVVLARRSR